MSVRLCGEEIIQSGDVGVEVVAAAPVEEVAGMYEDISWRDIQKVCVIVGVRDVYDAQHAGISVVHAAYS